MTALFDLQKLAYLPSGLNITDPDVPVLTFSESVKRSWS
jgi:hypothetical protein